MFSLSFFPLFAVILPSISTLPPICTPSSSIILRKTPVIQNYTGYTVLIYFTPLQCANCYKILKRLNELAIADSNYKIIVAVPNYESNHIISQTLSTFPSINIDQTMESWQRLGVQNFDAMIVDSCGRIAENIHWPNTDLTSSHTVRLALGSAEVKCGRCRNSETTKRVNAYINNDHQTVNQQGSRRYHHHQQQPNSNMNNNPQQYRRIQQFFTPSPPPPSFLTTLNTPTTEPEDYDYYPNDGENAPTNLSPQTQIPRPPQTAFRPTDHSLFLNKYTSQQHPYPDHFLENNLPCSAYTDDICYQQQERLNMPLPKCCDKGVYITDVCVPGKCSNSTTQLCCFQKFLQAKYSCCNDPTQDDGSKWTNKFNQCCHGHFVTDDPCCPAKNAQVYWYSVYEVCYPTVAVDFSPVRFEVNVIDDRKAHFAEGVRVIDLNVNRQWEFNCTYGKKRPQFAYLPTTSV